MNKKSRYIKRPDIPKNVFEKMTEPMPKMTEAEMIAYMQQSRRKLLQDCANYLGCPFSEVESHLQRNYDLIKLRESLL